MSLPEEAIVQFIIHRFPWWGNCHFRLMAASKSLYIYSHDPSKRTRILSELASLSTYDIGVEKIILVQPPHALTIVNSDPTVEQKKPVNIQYLTDRGIP